MNIIYHITSESDWAAAKERGVYTAPSLEKQGFIHCSTKEQVMDIAEFLFKGRTDVVMLAIDEDNIEPTIIYENLEGGERLFPHIYGELSIDAVVGDAKMTHDNNGEFIFPYDH